ncbi:MAG TPA: response regulator transcription factor [Chloroflexota bacterium]|nr:response regulator transcription factor [Chloroflexota bacterium]
METRLLILDSDANRRNELVRSLRDDGFAVVGVDSIATALEAAHQAWPHLVLADLRVVDGSAEQLASELNRLGDLSFIIVSAVADVAARVHALNRFADDYVIHPYCYDELLARVRRVLRRTLIGARLGDERIPLGDGRWADLSRRLIGNGDQVHHLTPTEARLLGLFLLNPGQTLPLSLILQRVWFDAPASTNTLWEYVRRLRAKLGDDARAPHYIVSQRGIGYCLRASDSAHDRGRELYHPPLKRAR